MTGCGNCCKDLVLPIQHLMFPDAFLDEPGKDFLKAHNIKPTELLSFECQGMTYNITLLGLQRPDLYLDIEGQRFYQVHLDALVRANARVKVLHRCEKLSPDGLCTIYANRPAVCRAFDCATRNDCTCNVQPPSEIKI